MKGQEWRMEVTKYSVKAATADMLYVTFTPFL